MLYKVYHSYKILNTVYFIQFMNIHQIQNQSELQKYNQWIKSHAEGNLWQSVEQKKYLEELGKEVRIYIGENNKKMMCSALVMIDRTSFGLSTWEIPRGPIGEGKEELLEKIVEDAKQDACMAVYLSPLHEMQHVTCGMQNSQRFVHCEATLVLDLTQSEADILAQMKQKGRYNIKVAEKHGVEVQESRDIDAYYVLAKQTGERDAYTIVSKKKYAAFLQSIPGAFLLLAYQKKEPIAGLLGVLWNKKAVYYYGASNHAYRASMAPYALQWAAIQKAKASGCTTYDLLGIAPEEAVHHAWAGITSFKEKFGGKRLRYPPEQIIVLRPYVQWLLTMKRRILS